MLGGVYCKDRIRGLLLIILGGLVAVLLRGCFGINHLRCFGFAFVFFL